MTPQEMKQLAELLQSAPGIKSVELKDVKGLAQLLRDSPEIGSIEVKGWFGTGVVITRTAAGPVFAPAPPARCRRHRRLPRRPREPPRAAPGPQGDQVADGGDVLQRARAGRRSVRQGGRRITPGQTVCIIEAMKIMNEIEAEISGVVREVCAEDAQPVEFGQVLFRVDPNG